ncbi:MAG: hypothetical protein SV422_15840, partial [Pseudomonadota bacterium]|nr:hypothetical protein [Pseudomonadota bacterium]
MEFIHARQYKSAPSGMATWKSMSASRHFTRHFTLTHAGESVSAADALAQVSALPKGRVKDAMAKGAVTLTRAGKSKRLRRATFTLLPGDRLDLWYDDAVLA